jgi:hypothetical protein
MAISEVNCVRVKESKVKERRRIKEKQQQQQQ